MFSFVKTFMDIRILKIYWLCVYVFFFVSLHYKILDKVKKSKVFTDLVKLNIGIDLIKLTIILLVEGKASV